MTDHLGEQPNLEELIKREKRKANRSFWVVVVLLPILLVSCITAGPQWIDKFRAYNAGLEGRSLAEAEEQAVLWRRNAACAARLPNRVQTENNLEVGAIVCPSGDVLIQVLRPDNGQFFRWVPLDSIVQPASGKPTRAE